MSDKDEKTPPRQAGRRKDGKRYAPGNTREDGGYEVGRNRPPAAGQFRAGDGRKRGRRPKGVANADTEFERELNRKVIIRENGKERRVTKGHSIDLRLIDNASGKGQNKAIEMVDQRRERIRLRKEENARRYHTRAHCVPPRRRQDFPRHGDKRHDPVGTPLPSRASALAR